MCGLVSTMNRKGFAFLLFLIFEIFIAQGWITPSTCARKLRQQQASSDNHILHATRRRNIGGSSSSSDENMEKGIPQLPPIGTSSSLRLDDSDVTSTDGGAQLQSKPFVAHHKFQLQYTCNICETRNAHSISRIAYRQGVVIARCKGCDSQHLIADNLGWTDYDGGFRGNQTNTIEDYFANDQNVTVNRVSTEVFELEKILQLGTGKSGSIVGDNGQRALE
jgi:DNL zinc finger